MGMRPAALAESSKNRFLESLPEASAQPAQKLVELATAAVAVGGREGAPQRCGDAGMSWRNVYSDHLPVQFLFRRRQGLTLRVHLPEKRAGTRKFPFFGPLLGSD